MEIWKNINGYEGIYQISNEKRVRKCKTGKILRVQNKGHSDYVILSSNGTRRQIKLEILYNETFDIHIKDLEGEIWKEVKGYDGDYEISNYGRFKSYKRGEQIIKPSLDRNGYPTVGLYKDGISKTINIHRLVAEHFVGGYKEGLVVNHIDENKTNNHFENLEWVTQYENVHHGTRTQRQSQTMIKKGINCKKIYCVELDKVFNSIKEASETTNTNRTSISYSLRGVQHTAGGYHWVYLT